MRQFTKLEVVIMKKILLGSLIALQALTWGTSFADDEHHCGISENRPGIKLFRWGENRSGDCHQVGGTLEIRSNGTATFHSDIWTHTHGRDVWHSKIRLRGPAGDLGGSGEFRDSPGMPHDHDGPANPVRLDYDFSFTPQYFDGITEAVEISKC